MDGKDLEFMHRALELAELGRGSVSPNPMVGCVIVHEGKVVGEGYHQRYGEAHAEVNALNSVENKNLLPESAAYVTLEPCVHFGKTPPCVDLLIQKRIKKVVVASDDPFKEVAGKGIQKLSKAGVEVVTGVLQAEADKLNARFMTFHKKKRPYVILKWAQTHDGFIARDNFDSKWISNEQSRQLVHKWRTEEDAILIGKNTALYDNPHLTARDWNGRNPTRILLDPNLEIDEKSNLFDGESKTLIFNKAEEREKGSNKWMKLADLSPRSVLARLHEIGVQSVIVEGGAKVLNSFIGDNCWDEARVFNGPKDFGSGMEAPKIEGQLVKEEMISEDTLKIYKS